MYDDDEDLDDAERAERAERRQARSAAAARHGRNLAAVDALAVLEGTAAPAPWRAEPVPITLLQGDVAELRKVTDGGVGALLLSGAGGAWDVALVAALRNGARDRLAATRRLLERHAPNLDGWPVECAHCIDGQENPYAFPCDNYVDAEAGLVMPHRVMVLPDPGGRQMEAACIGCGWSRVFPYARATGATVAARLADIWTRRHLDGDPAAQLGAAGEVDDGSGVVAEAAGATPPATP